MQTFLPFEDFAKTAEVLDRKRLFKQSVETLQIMQALTQRRLISGRIEFGPRGGKKTVPLPRDEWRIEHTAVGWANHPATRMWNNSAFMLLEYQDAICAELRKRDLNDGGLVAKTELVYLDAVDYMETGGTPRWWRVPGFHESHRSNLLRKDPSWYGQFGWTESPDLGYVWP